MSNIYNTEPPPSGKVLLSTSKGDLEIELWAKECPKACRNFIALALEGYYDGLVWHRIVPGFCVQSGDPTGTGTGGESFYGEPFQDEPHQRLRFNRRGLLAMANPGERDHNESQFFITLDATPELQNKHTLFGRISGSTIYNLLALSEVELSETEPDRPVFPPKLHSVKVIDNPFDDIVPRITKEEKRAQEANRKRAKLEAKKRGTGEKVKKNTGLLSFGGDEEEGDAGADKFKKGPMSSHDLLKNDKRLRKEPAPRENLPIASSPAEQSPASEPVPPLTAHPSRKKRKTEAEDAPIDLSSIRSQHALSQGEQSTASRIAELESSIRGLAQGPDTTSAKKAKKVSKGKELLAAARAQYTQQSSSSGSRRDEKRERDTMELLRKFQMGSDIRKKSRAERERESERDREEEASRQQKQKEEEEAMEEGMREYGGSDGDDDEDDGGDWRKHKFHSVKEDEDGTAAGEDQYVTLDPRDTTSANAASLGFGSDDQRKRAREEQLRATGRRGRDWVDDRGGHDRRGGGGRDRNDRW